jgi:molybdate transport system permease protein
MPLKNNEKNKGIIKSNRFFYLSLAIITLCYVCLILMLIIADGVYLFTDNNGGNPLFDILKEPEIKNSVILSMISCSLTAFLATGFAIPIGYILSRFKSKWVTLLDSFLDIPLVLPPLVIGLSLLILFQLWPLNAPLSDFLPLGDEWGSLSLKSLVVYQVPAVVLAQFTVATAFAVRTLKLSFEQIPSRAEQVALTLGCSRFQAFYHVVLPQAIPGILTAWTLAWARSLGEFGPLLVFAGATRNKTEVLSTSVFLELSIGNLKGAVALSMIMIATAIVVLVVARLCGRSAYVH